MRALNKAWRLAGTALSFMVFGLGALLLAVPMSLNRLLPGPPARRARRGQTSRWPISSGSSASCRSDTRWEAQWPS